MSRLSQFEWRFSHGIAVCLILATVTMFGACAGRGVRLENDELYHRLGGRRELAKISADLIATWAGDQRRVGESSLADKLARAPSPGLQEALFHYTCWLTGGPCREAALVWPEGMSAPELANLEWFYLLDGLVRTLERHNVPERERNEVLDLVFAQRSRLVRSTGAR